MNDSINEIINSCDIELEKIKETIDEMDTFDKTRAFLTKYALMKASGTIEYSYRNMVADYFDNANLPQVPTYIEQSVRKGSMSGTYQNMVRLLKSFDEDWANDFKIRVNNLDDKDKVIQSAESLVNNRHNFAHGKEPTATLNDVLDYYSDAKKLVKIIDTVICCESE